MADTTIGYAVLQIIPSLKGVSEAIEKQIAGQTVSSHEIEPKTDSAKVDKSVKDAVKKKPPSKLRSSRRSTSRKRSTSRSRMR
jgi:hypothetical protein